MALRDRVILDHRDVTALEKLGPGLAIAKKPLGSVQSDQDPLKFEKMAYQGERGSQYQALWKARLTKSRENVRIQVLDSGIREGIA